MEPLDGAVWVVTADHLPVGHLATQAVRGLVGVHGHVQHLLRHRQVGGGVAGGGLGLILLLFLLLSLLFQAAAFLLVFHFLLDRYLLLLLCF